MTPCPDGITDANGRRDTGLRRHASPVSILVLGGLLTIAMTGVLGGGKTATRIVESPAATLSVNVPHTLRNGLFFETRIEVIARRDLADATIAVPPDLWRDETINTMIPAAGTEEFKNGAFRFRYGPLKAGEMLTVKIDGQINPPLFAGTAGEVALLDGDAMLAALPLRIRVLP